MNFAPSLFTYFETLSVNNELGIEKVGNTSLKYSQIVQVLNALFHLDLFAELKKKIKRWLALFK